MSMNKYNEWLTRLRKEFKGFKGARQDFVFGRLDEEEYHNRIEELVATVGELIKNGPYNETKES